MIYIFADAGSGGGWLSQALIKRESRINAWRRMAMLVRRVVRHADCLRLADRESVGRRAAQQLDPDLYHRRFSGSACAAVDLLAPRPESALRPLKPDRSLYVKTTFRRKQYQ
jgi:hypothetical protein